MPIIDILLLAIVGLVAWCVASDGAWSAGITLLSVLFAGLLAMNFFEPLANGIQGAAPGWANEADMVALVGLFIAFVFGFRLASEYLVPTYVYLPNMMHDVARWICGGAAGYITMAFLLTALHTAPLPREFLGFTPERDNLFGIAAPDRQWLGFTQYVSERSLGKFQYVQYRNELKKEAARIFDGPQMVLGDPASPYPNLVWPSFPMRYATRREQLAGGGTVSMPTAPPTIQQRSPSSSATGGF